MWLVVVVLWQARIQWWRHRTVQLAGFSQGWESHRVSSLISMVLSRHTWHVSVLDVFPQRWTRYVTPLGNVSVCVVRDVSVCGLGLLIILCDHMWSKTRLIVIMNLIATLGITYTSLHYDRLSEYQLSLPPHRAYYYIQTGHRERGEVGSSCSSSTLCVVCCVGRH